jgi:hypothetical protein
VHFLGPPESEKEQCEKMGSHPGLRY